MGTWAFQHAGVRIGLAGLTRFRFPWRIGCSSDRCACKYFEKVDFWCRLGLSAYGPDARLGACAIPLHETAVPDRPAATHPKRFPQDVYQALAPPPPRGGGLPLVLVPEGNLQPFGEMAKLPVARMTAAGPWPRTS